MTDGTCIILAFILEYWLHIDYEEIFDMSRIQTLNTRNLAESVIDGGCGECQTSCQSACKTSCGVANQPCEHC